MKDKLIMSMVVIVVGVFLIMCAIISVWRKQ